MLACRLSITLMWLCVASCGQRATDDAATERSATSLASSAWSDELGAHTLREFERRSGVRVTLDPIVDNVTLKTKPLVGRSGYDVVMPTNNFLKPLIAWTRVNTSKAPPQ